MFMFGENLTYKAIVFFYWIPLEIVDFDGMSNFFFTLPICLCISHSLVLFDVDFGCRICNSHVERPK